MKFRSHVAINAAQEADLTGPAEDRRVPTPAELDILNSKETFDIIPQESIRGVL
jgi:hypothetical protein